MVKKESGTPILWDYLPFWHFPPKFLQKLMLRDDFGIIYLKKNGYAPKNERKVNPQTNFFTQNQTKYI